MKKDLTYGASYVKDANSDRLITKRNGELVHFNPEKIKNAIQKANNKMQHRWDRLTSQEIEDIVELITQVYDRARNQYKKKDKKYPSVEFIQDEIEAELVRRNHYPLAKEYMTYRYQRALARKKNTTDESIMQLIKNENKELAEENSNKNTMLASTQRDYIAGEVSRDITQRMLLPENIVKAHQDGILHFHDMDYFIQPIFNCCLINIKDILDNGTVMNGKMIESPKSFQVACTVMTQVIAAVASNQYGGQSVNVKHLGKYLAKTRAKFTKELEPEFGDNKELLEKVVDIRVKDELKAGVQTIQYQINTLMTTNGQSPFVTLFLHLDLEDEYYEETALIIEEILRQRIEGIKNEKGIYVTPEFPKLIYVLDEHNCLEGGKYDYLTEIAIQCSIKRMYPDYISAKKMRENYEGRIFSPMGCTTSDSLVDVKIDGHETLNYPIGDLWLNSSYAHGMQLQHNLHDEFIDVDDIEIWDSKLNKYVKVTRLIKNEQKDWVHVTFDNGKEAHVTSDHPFEDIDGNIVHGEDVTVGTKMYSSDYHGPHEVATVSSVRKYTEKKYSYDVTTESEHFMFNGIYSHNCRSFLSPWKDENGNYKFEGRFNQGVVSLNLPQIAILADKSEKTFWSLLDERLEICFEALMCRHKALEGTPSDISPIHWQYGAISRLEKGETIDKLLHGGYSTISLGYIGIYETTKLMKGVSHTDPVGTEFALRVMNKLREATDRWKKETGIGFGLYGTPAESLCYRFARIDKEKFGDIPDVTDKGYYTNSYHVDVREHIDAFKKLEFESQFQTISSGGAISYIEVPNMAHNVEAMRTLVNFIYHNIQYGEFNTKSDYCHKCGFDGEIIINDDNEWECPNCGNKDKKHLTVTRRTCGLNPR